MSCSWKTTNHNTRLSSRNTSQMLKWAMLLAFKLFLLVSCTVIMVHTYQTAPTTTTTTTTTTTIGLYGTDNNRNNYNNVFVRNNVFPFPSKRQSNSQLYYMNDDKDQEASIPKSSSKRVITKEEESSSSRTSSIEKLIRQKHNLKDDEPIMWRVLLHNDQSHSFSYVVQSVVKVVGIVTRAQAWEICVEAHGNDKATICKVWKAKAEQFCLGLQRQGLTASIVPDYEFKPQHNFYTTTRASDDARQQQPQVSKMK